MIVCAATLLFILLVFMPIRLNVLAEVYFSRLSANIRVKAFGIKVFNETISLKGKMLECSGTVETQIDLTQMEESKGKGLLQCVTFDSLYVCFQNNLSTVSTQIILAENFISAIATGIACGISNCQIASSVYACVGESKVCAQITASFNVAELSFCLLKQGVQSWMRKYRKS